MSETYRITFHVRPSERDRFLSLLNHVLDEMRHEATFIQATLHADPEDKNQFELHETWADRQDVLDVQLKRPYRTEWHAALDHILDRPREVKILTVMRTDGGRKF